MDSTFALLHSNIIIVIVVFIMLFLQIIKAQITDSKNTVVGQWLNPISKLGLKTINLVGMILSAGFFSQSFVTLFMLFPIN